MFPFSQGLIFMALLVIMSIRHFSLIVEKTQPQNKLLSVLALQSLKQQHRIIFQRSEFPPILRGQVISERVSNCTMTLSFAARITEEESQARHKRVKSSFQELLKEQLGAYGLNIYYSRISQVYTRQKLSYTTPLQGETGLYE